MPASEMSRRLSCASALVGASTSTRSWSLIGTRSTTVLRWRQRLSNESRRAAEHSFEIGDWIAYQNPVMEPQLANRLLGCPYSLLDHGHGLTDLAEGFEVAQQHYRVS